MNPQTIHTIFKRFEQANPKPAIELNFTTPFELLIAVILSARATDKSVNKATPALFKVANTPERIVGLGEKALGQYIKTIGLYQNKAKNIIRASQILIDEHHAKVPHRREALEALPGVGRKTANVILNTYFGEPVIAVDTHIFRVAQRIGLAKGKTPRAIEEALTKIVPDTFKKSAHHWLVLHGRYVCKALKPLCRTCLIKDLCEYPEKST